MYSGPDTLERVGFPIRTSADQRSLASPRGFSQRATSFIASWRQGIHRTPLSRSISHHHRPHAGPNRPATERSRNTNRSAHTQPTGHAHRPLTLPSNPSSLVKEHSPARTPRGIQRHAAVLEVHITQTRPCQAIPRQAAGHLAPPIAQSRMMLSHHRSPNPSRAHPGALTEERRSGGKRIRTDDPLLAKQVLYQLSYAPAGLAARTTSPAATEPPPQDQNSVTKSMGQGGLEPPTPRLSSVCSNQLSYWPPAPAITEAPTREGHRPAKAGTRHPIPRGRRMRGRRRPPKGPGARMHHAPINGRR